MPQLDRLHRQHHSCLRRFLRYSTSRICTSTPRPPTSHFGSFPCPVCPMSNTDPSFPGTVGASFMAATLGSSLCPMPTTDTSFLGLVVGASLMAAYFYSCPMSIAESSLNSTIGASLNRAHRVHSLWCRPAVIGIFLQ